MLRGRARWPLGLWLFTLVGCGSSSDKGEPVEVPAKERPTAEATSASPAPGTTSAPATAATATSASTASPSESASASASASATPTESAAPASDEDAGAPSATPPPPYPPETEWQKQAAVVTQKSGVLDCALKSIGDWNRVSCVTGDAATTPTLGLVRGDLADFFSGDGEAGCYFHFAPGADVDVFFSSGSDRAEFQALWTAGSPRPPKAGKFVGAPAQPPPFVATATTTTPSRTTRTTRTTPTTRPTQTTPKPHPTVRRPPH